MVTQVEPGCTAVGCQISDGVVLHMHPCPLYDQQKITTVWNAGYSVGKRHANEDAEKERDRLLNLMFDAEKAIIGRAGEVRWSPFNAGERRAYELCAEIVARFSARAAYPRGES